MHLLLGDDHDGLVGALAAHCEDVVLQSSPVPYEDDVAAQARRDRGRVQTQRLRYVVRDRHNLSSGRSGEAMGTPVGKTRWGNIE